MRTYKRTVVACLVCALTLLAGVVYIVAACGQNHPHAYKGVLDLTRWDYAEDPLIFLRGEWEFYWNSLLDPSDLLGAPAMTGYISLPKSWNDYEVEGKKAGADGYATFVLRVKTRGTGERLALNIPGINTAYRLWINGVPKLSVGAVGRSANTTVACDRPSVVEFDDDGGETEIVIQASNYLHRTGGIWSDLELGTARAIQTLTNWRTMIDMGSFGALGIMGIYNLCLFAKRKHDRSDLYFGLVCLAFSIRTLLMGQVILTLLFPRLSWAASIAVQYLFSSALLPLGIAYVETSYPDDVKIRVTPIATIVWLVFSAVSVTASPRVSTRVALCYVAFDVIICLFIFGILMRAVARKRPGAGAVAAGACVFVLAILVDMLYFQEILPIGNFSQLGLVFMCFMQSYALSVRFSGAFSEVEQLSKELASVNNDLTALNRHLESRVEERTAELLDSNRKLEAMNKEIARIEQSRKHLLANIAHDLRTPVTLIRGYSEAMLDGVVEGPEAKAKYLSLIRSKVEGLATLIENLFELTQLESRRTAFSPRIVDAVELIERLFRKYETDIEGAGLEPRLRLPDPVSRPACVNADTDHIDRVLSNLIYNAVKFTPKGGWVSVSCSYEYPKSGANHMFPSAVVYRVQDNGPGIDEHDVPFIFDRFYKAPRARTSAAGSGLGLSIAKEIVELHGGRIWVESRKNEGSAFCFSLPAMPEPEIMSAQ